MLPKDKRPKTKPALDLTKGYAIVRTDAGLETVALSSVREHIGSFQGKQGSTKRSNKGATRIRPNGRRKYVGSTDVDVIAYKV